MNTSLGNTLGNYVSLRVTARLMGFTARAVVEGDDALISVPPGTDPERYRTIMRSMGFNVKIDTFSSPGSAGYCSMYWDSDLNTTIKLNTRLPDICWCSPSALHHSTRQELLNSRLASLSYQCRDIPCLWKFFDGHRATDRLNQYDRSCVMGATDFRTYTEFYGLVGTEPTMAKRAAYASMCGLSVSDQMTIESQNHTLAETIALMYSLSTDTTFAASQYELQVQRHPQG